MSFLISIIQSAITFQNNGGSCLIGPLGHCVEFIRYFEATYCQPLVVVTDTIQCLDELQQVTHEESCENTEDRWVRSKQIHILNATTEDRWVRRKQICILNATTEDRWVRSKQIHILNATTEDRWVRRKQIRILNATTDYF